MINTSYLLSHHHLRLIVFVGYVILNSSFHHATRPSHRDEGFKRNQLSNSRVLAAYEEKIDSIDNWLLTKNIAMMDYEILIRAFKKEEQFEVWVKGKGMDTFAFYKLYKICAMSGFLGPKLKQGDKQIPEGVYYINEFNPYSNYHLSLGINYPNRADSILGVKGRWGGDIYIHGACESIGCLPITTKRVKEVYILAMQARYFGQKRIPVHIFPCRLTRENYKSISKSYNNPAFSRLWGSLRSLYIYFEATHVLPRTFIDDGGQYYFYPK